MRPWLPSLPKLTPLTLALVVLVAGAFQTAPAHGQQCQSFAKRQIGLVDNLLDRESYPQALKVLDRTAENCDIPSVQEKAAEVMGAWYSSIWERGATGEFPDFAAAVSNHPALTSTQRSALQNEVESGATRLIRQSYNQNDYGGAYQYCQSYSQYTSGSFGLMYYCGRAAQEQGARYQAADYYSSMLNDWSEDQSYLEWSEAARTLKQLYYATAQFDRAYEVSRRMAVRDTSPERILASLIAARGTVLEPILRVGSTALQGSPNETELDHIQTEMSRIQFPEYVEALYVVGSSGSVQTELMGADEMDAPSPSQLSKVSGAVTLLKAKASSRVWLATSVDDGYLLLQYGRATSPKENVRLENVLDNVESDKQWTRLYDLEQTTTFPATGSAVATFIGGSYLSDEALTDYQTIFDDSGLLRYYCVQNESRDIEASHAFNKGNLGYGDGGWQRTSNTPALFHHPITYNGQPTYEVIWPTYVDDNWSGVIRVGLARE